MSNTIRLRPSFFRHPQMHQRVLAGQWKNRTLPQDLLDGDWANQYPSDEGNWNGCADEVFLLERSQTGWLEHSKMRRAKLRLLIERRRLR